MARRIIRFLAAAMLSWLVALQPALADYRQARESYEARTPQLQLEIALALIASGDFEALAGRGFTQYLYRAIRRFEAREGFTPNGVLNRAELLRLKQVGEAFYAKLGNRFYTHPETGVRLLVPRQLFDAEQTTPEGIMFTRKDRLLSLIFLSFLTSEKSYDALWRQLSSTDGGKHIVYKRRFNTHFVVTGTFNQHKFYSWMTKTGRSTTGFTLSWGAPWDAMGRKLSVLLANAYLAEGS